jgi:hypothetical protein
MNSGGKLDLRRLALKTLGALGGGAALIGLGVVYSRTGST